MKLSALLLVSAVYAAGVVGTSPCKHINRCERNLADKAGSPDLASRISDCKSLDTVTVSPYTVTVTETFAKLAVRIPTGRPTPRNHERAYLENFVRAAPATTATATTLYPTALPTYATYCESAAAYYSACSHLGITAATTTLPTPTYTSSSTSSDCPLRRMVRRGGEMMGYEYPDGWDSYNMPGIHLF